MCGIVGYQGAFSQVSLRAGLAAIAHRGPDDSGTFFDDAAGVALGHVRLSILDLSALGHQPMSIESAGVTLIFNGEIYNFRELRDDLSRAGYVFRGNSDTEVLLNLYLRDGAEMLRRLNGIFAFAIWDARSGEMFIARDALGVKPLYYCLNTKGIAFASEIKGLVPIAPSIREIDPISISRYLTYLWCPGEDTPLKGVKKVNPGEALIVAGGKIQRRWTWYTLPAFRSPHLIDSLEDCTAGIVDGLRTAVHRQMVSDVPVGAFLSGGLDSSSVIAFAREVNSDLRCFTIEASGGLEDGAVDDLPYARRVARHLGVELDVVQIDAATMAEDVVEMVSQLDEPLADPAPLNVLYISRLARSRGMKVLLSGSGGDDLLTGYRRHAAVQYEHYWRWLPHSARRGLEHVSAMLDQRKSWSRRVGKLFSGASMDGNAAIANHFAWSRRENLSALFSSDLRQQLRGLRADKPLVDFIEPLSNVASPLDRMLALEQRFFLADHNLTYTDKMSMAVGLEVRVPFLDLDFVEYCARIPMKYKQRGSVGKWILKRAMEPYLPRDVIYRPKSGFGAPLRRWMQHDLRPIVMDMLSAGSLKNRGLFDPDAVSSLIVANDTGKTDASYTLLSLLCIEVWCRRFIDKR